MSWPLVSASSGRVHYRKELQLADCFNQQIKLCNTNFNLTAQSKITILNGLYALAASNMNENWVPKHLHSSAKTR